MPRYLQRVVYAHATRRITNATHAPHGNLRWPAHKWPRNGIVLSDPETTVSNSCRTLRPTLAAATARIKRAQEIARLSSTYPNFRAKSSVSRAHEVILRRWEANGPPPITEYELTFGKHKGKRLEEVPDSYLVKYLIPRSGPTGGLSLECPLVVEAIEDFRKRYPNIKGQAGSVKTKALPNRDMQTEVPVRKGRKTAIREGGGSASASL